MRQRFCQRTKLLPQLLRPQQLRLVPEGEYPAEHAVGIGKAAGKAQPSVRFLGETIRPYSSTSRQRQDGSKRTVT